MIARVTDTAAEPRALVLVVDGHVLDVETASEIDAWPGAVVAEDETSLLGSEHVTVEQAIARVRACNGLDLSADVDEGVLREVVVEAFKVVAALTDDAGLVRPVAARLLEALDKIGGAR